MAYELDAIIASRSVAGSVSTAMPGTCMVELSAGLALVPLSKDAIASLSPARRWGRARWLLDGKPIPQPVNELLARESAGGAVAYVEAEFFGGDGAQASVVWEHGGIVLGPLVDPPDYPHKDRPPEDPRLELARLPINRALQRLGVQRAAQAVDEFATVGLGRHRSTEEWHRTDPQT
jgi:hypothetical protein